MPELPDVEVFRRYLNSTALHKKISGIEVRTKKILEGVSARTLRDRLAGRSFSATGRRGKYLFARLEGDGWLVEHFGMTGELKYFQDPADEPDHTRMLLLFNNGYRLAYVNVRLLGKIAWAKTIEEFADGHNLGPDALEIGRDDFAGILEKKRGSLKAALMNQSDLSGIGNIYSDEILFQAGLHPQSEPRDLDRETVNRLHRTMRRVLKTAIGNKADPEKFPRGYLTGKREEGADCPRCGGKIERLKISGRSAYFCPGCQKQ
jgi:formamidopyrimidine-DNA glycosylase